MGLSPFSRSCSLRPSGRWLPMLMSAPNPARFEIVRSVARGSSCVAEVRYPDCTNFEGRKVLVFLRESPEGLARRATLDPHFSAAGGGPFARFEPTEAGWRWASRLAMTMSNELDKNKDQ
jgi:hypothetical protein